MTESAISDIITAFNKGFYLILTITIKIHNIISYIIQ